MFIRAFSHPDQNTYSRILLELSVFDARGIEVTVFPIFALMAWMGI